MINRLRLLPVIVLAAAPFGRAAEVSASGAASDSVVTAPSSFSSTATLDAVTAPVTYTVKKGESIWDVSHKFHCTVTALKTANALKKNHLKTGQVLEIPVGNSPAAQTALATPKPKGKKSSAKKVALGKTHHAYPAAQPVQDFDVPASTFASCPTPPSNGSDDEALAAPEVTTIPSAQPSPKPVVPVATSTAPVHSTLASLTHEVPAPSLTPPPPVKKSLASALADFFGGSHSTTSESGEWGNRVLTEARTLASHGIGYNQSWRPDGESHSWTMDCSNTSRYLYQVTAGIQLPRTASDQYYYLHLQNKAWDVPTVANGFADCNFLRSNLKPGDLLFWENTYRPDRQPPITHVMIFLGTNEKGQWIMAGSQSSHGGRYNPHRNGPDVYVFDPTRPSGGYTTWLGLVHHQGRFCAYGRPLEADVKKLSVAAND
jgi:cell wall-associated NlpC family hydrolase